MTGSPPHDDLTVPNRTEQQDHGEYSTLYSETWWSTQQRLLCSYSSGSPGHPINHYSFQPQTNRCIESWHWWKGVRGRLMCYISWPKVTSIFHPHLSLRSSSSLWAKRWWGLRERCWTRGLIHVVSTHTGRAVTLTAFCNRELGLQHGCKAGTNDLDSVILYNYFLSMCFTAQDFVLYLCKAFRSQHNIYVYSQICYLTAF